MKKNILIIGGAGYIGTELCNYLVNKKYNVTCLDTFWFGNFLDKKVKKIKCDIRNLKSDIFKKRDVVINLAYLSNDPLCEINARGTWEIGPLATHFIMENCIKHKVKKFIILLRKYLWFKKEKKVTENLGLDPITDYNKSKMITEKVVNSYSDKISTIILRPATVCGFSKRLRLDVVLNLFCYQAMFEKRINILGGKQIRPLVSIKDMVRCYEFFINSKHTGTFNVGFENQSVSEIAKTVSNLFNCKIEIKKSNDPRSYRIDSSKLIKLGFKPLYNHIDAAKDLKFAFQKKFKPSLINWNLKWLLDKKIIKNDR